jgi:apolipoprotein D and lipocalin family protein
MRIAIGLLSLIVLAAVSFVDVRLVEPTPVAGVDLSQYMGLWYAIAHIPTTFERNCAQGTTAHYQMLENGRVVVTNTCYASDGTTIRVVGRAWIPDKSEPAKLKVSFVSLFGLWLFPGDYWILDLAPDYSYAVVGHPQLRYGWILSRTPTLPSAVLEGIFTRLEEQGYSRDAFVMIDQSMSGPKKLSAPSS